LSYLRVGKNQGKMLVKIMDLKQKEKLNKNQRTSLSTWQEEFSERMS
jgi:hypothetical protein